MEARQGMLRPDFQDWYPGLEAGRWYPASELTALVVDRAEKRMLSVKA